MSEWIRYDVTLPTKPRLIRVKSILKVSRNEAVGLVMRFWAWAQQMTESGVIANADAGVVDAAVDHDGFAAAMIAVGWLEIEGTTATVPKWDDHLSGGAKERGMAAKRMAEKRARDASVTPKLRAERNASVTRGEERRLEEIRKDSLSHSAPSGCPEREIERASQTENQSASTSPPSTLPTSNLPAPNAATPFHSNGTAGPASRLDDQNAAQPIVDETKCFPLGELSPYQLERMEAAGQLPNLAKFKAAYPAGRVKKKAAIREAWNRKGCEANPAPVMAGLAKWKGCEDWRNGYADAAENFIENEQWKDTPPAPKVKRNGEPPPTVADPDADAERERCWKAYMAMGEEDRADLLRSNPKTASFADKPLDTPGIKGAVMAAMKGMARP